MNLLDEILAMVRLPEPERLRPVRDLFKPYPWSDRSDRIDRSDEFRNEFTYGHSSYGGKSRW